MKKWAIFLVFFVILEEGFSSHIKPGSTTNQSSAFKVTKPDEISLRWNKIAGQDGEEFCIGYEDKEKGTFVYPNFDSLFWKSKFRKSFRHLLKLGITFDTESFDHLTGQSRIDKTVVSFKPSDLFENVDDRDKLCMNSLLNIHYIDKFTDLIGQVKYKIDPGMFCRFNSAYYNISLPGAPKNFSASLIEEGSGDTQPTKIYPTLAPSDCYIVHYSIKDHVIDNPELYAAIHNEILDLANQTELTQKQREALKENALKVAEYLDPTKHGYQLKIAGNIDPAVLASMLAVLIVAKPTHALIMVTLGAAIYSPTFKDTLAELDLKKRSELVDKLKPAF